MTYLSGDSTVVIRDDATATWTMNDVTFRISQGGQALTMIWNSVVDNAYVADGFWHGEGGTAVVDVEVVEYGFSQVMSVESAFSEAAAYDCEPGESLVITRRRRPVAHLHRSAVTRAPPRCRQRRSAGGERCWIDAEFVHARGVGAVQAVRCP